MKRLLVVVMILFAATGAFAQTFLNLNQYQAAFQDFANGVAPALPLDSSVGLNWSDAYIGQFPHFGIGITGGAATIPYSAVSKALTDLGGSVPSNLGFISSIGVPLPAYSIDLRIGGFKLPFDIGLKFGYIPSSAFSGSGISLNYTLVGGDFRYALLKDGPGSPGLSVGIGYTYMSGTVDLPGALGGDIKIQNVVVPGNIYNLDFSSPTLYFQWDTNVVDLKAQLSKNLRIITPYIGTGVSYGISHAGGGLQSTFTINGLPATQTEIDQINSTYGSNFTLSGLGFGASDAASGLSARVFGGFSLNLFILKIGFGAEYELLSGSIAGMANVRFQF